jgi:thioredoxin reductase (NADPH)
MGIVTNLYDIAIVGAGPAGIASAVESIVLGIKNVVIFEKGDSHSMTIRQFYKDNKRVDKNWKGQEINLDGNVMFVDGTKESTIDLFDKLIDNHNIDARFNTEISKIRKYDDIFLIETGDKKTYKAKTIIIAIGKMGKPNPPSYKIPPSIKSVANYNLDKVQQHEKIIVVGGGNSAVEYAFFLASNGVDTTLSYRREEFSRVNPENIVSMQEVIDKNQLKTKLGVDIDSIENISGKVQVNFANGDKEIYDRIIYALGGVMPTDFLKNCGVELNEKNHPIYNENFESATEGLYIAGDIAADIGGSIAMSLNHSFAIINHIKDTKL